MIYENNRKQSALDRALFENPTAEYRGTPFWAWNCDLDEAELLRQIDIFKEMGLGGFHMHVRTGMSTTYLSQEFMHLIRACTEHAKEQEMLSWLYDEDRWPSGAAGGYVTRTDEYRHRLLVLSCRSDYPVAPNTVILGRYDVVLDENKCLASYRTLAEGECAEGRVWTAYRIIAGNSPWYNNQSYVDTLNPKAIQRFVEVTHEAYAREVGDEFGKTIPAIFTDEPQFSRKQNLGFADGQNNVSIPWTDDLEDTFRATYGDSLLDHLPELFWELPNGAVSLTRYRFHDHVAERFAEAFADTCGKWCDEHGIALTGHMMEEPTLDSQTRALGDCMRSYRSFGIPGIDMLCARFELTTAKQAQSAVHQYGRLGMMSELYGVTGWDFDFRGHKLHGDWQAALGVTVRVQHLSWVSMKGNAKRDYPASISYQSPWYKEYRYVEDHFARVNTALTRGTPVVKVGVIHPVESYWLHFGPEDQTALARERLDENFRNITDWLLKGSIDFDYISESLLPDQCPVGGAPLQVGKMAYDVVIVPECETLRSTTLERLEAFAAGGGKLIFLGDAPLYENAVPSERGRALYEGSRRVAFSKGAVLAALDEDRLVEMRTFGGVLTGNLLHQLRRDGDGLWLFVARACEPYNKDVTSTQGTHIYVKGKYKAELWDTLTGEVRPIRYSNRGGDRTHIIVTLHDYDSLLIRLIDTEEDAGWEPPALPSLRELGGVPEKVAYTLSEPNVLLLDLARFALDDGAFEGPEEVLRADTTLRHRLGIPARNVSVAQPWVIEDTPAEHTVTLAFTVHSEIDYPTPVLALEDADIAEIVWNGEPVASADGDLGYYTDLSIRKVALPPLCKGDNTLTVKLPFGKRTNIERMYLLGDFGVRIAGRELTVTALPETLGFSDITYQGLPFYGGVVSYHLPVACPEAMEAVLKIPHYRAAVNTVEVDGVKQAVVAYPPYDCALGVLTPGEHTVTVNAYISRRNAFGDVHNADEIYSWQGPVAWVTTGSQWTYEYRLYRQGLLSMPMVYRT